jgi:hypothetical protein
MGEGQWAQKITLVKAQLLQGLPKKTVGTRRRTGSEGCENLSHVPKAAQGLEDEFSAASGPQERPDERGGV